MNSDLRIAADLRKAADYLRTHGWIQGRAYGITGPDGYGPACIGGAILETCGDQCSVEYARALGLGLNEYPEDPDPSCFWGFMPAWNDTTGRTLEEVLDRLESTALGLEIKALSETLEVHVPLESVEEAVTA